MSEEFVLKYCGIDVSKSSLVCATVGDLDEEHNQYLPGQAKDIGIINDEPLLVKTFDNSWTGVVAMTRWLHSLGVSVAVMESTGSYWCGAYDALEHSGIQPVLANPAQVKNVSVHKTDYRDSVWLAVLLRAGFIIPSYVPAGSMKELRDLTRMRARIVKDKTRLKNRCHNILDSMLMKLGASDVFGAKGRQTLLRALTGDYDGLTEDQHKAFSAMSESQGMMVVDLIAEVSHMEERVTSYESAIARVVEKIEGVKGDTTFRLLTTIPGVRVIYAATILSEIGDISRFATPERLSSYAGLAPRVIQSGKKDTTGRTGHMCNRHLRTAMFMVAQTCTRFGPPGLRQFYEMKRKKKGDYRKAVIAVARKLMGVIWRMLQDATPFDMTYDRAQEKRKERRVRGSLKRLKKLEKEYGPENVHQALKEYLENGTEGEQDFLISVKLPS
ncbi:MAG: IS110 family transposase [Candidatus Thorarchaeota archaeon]